MSLQAQCRDAHHRLMAYATRNLHRFLVALVCGDLAGALVWLQRVHSNLERAAELRLAATLHPRR